MSAVLTARDLTRHYSVSRGLFKGHATVRALNGVSFQLDAGKTLAVVGESGCGKSTLARALTLIEEPSSGSLQIAGREVAGASSEGEPGSTPGGCCVVADAGCTGARPASLS